MDLIQAAKGSVAYLLVMNCLNGLLCSVAGFQKLVGLLNTSVGETRLGQAL